MSIALFGTVARYLVIVLALVLGGATVIAVRQGRGRLGALLGLGGLLAIGALVAEALVALTVKLAAPGASDFNEYRWVMLAPWGRLGLALGGAIVIAIVALAWRASRNAAPWRRAMLIGLRAGAAVAALVMFLEPAVELRNVAREPNRVAILIDDSKSMSLAETAGGPTRIARVRALLAASADALAAWRKDHELDLYTFSETTNPTSLAALADDEAKGKATAIRKALEYVRGRYEGRDLAGIVLISDGAATGGFGDDAGDGANRDFLRGLDTRVHTIWAGRPGLQDVAIAKVMADEFAFVRTVVRIDAVIRTTGLPARQVPVTLSTDGQPLRQKLVDLPAGDADVKVTFEITPPRVGRYVYEVGVPVVAGEAVPSNNTKSFVVRVIRDKIRVLQVAGQPSWDVRALRQMLKSNPNVDLISFFILRTQDDVSLVPNDEMSLIPFPTRELFEQQLPSFDLIILQNFEYLPYGIGDYLENIRSYVEGGGGLAMLGGATSFSSGGYYGTPVAAALPVELFGPFDPGAILDTQKFTPMLTDAGLVHPVTALRYSQDDNRAAWKGLPQLEGVNIIKGAKPDAIVLATHPRLRTTAGKPMPVIVAGEYGKGRSLAVTTDTLWRLGFVAAARPGDDGRQYTRFWESSMRWLIQDPDLRNLHVDTDAVEYLPNAPIRVAVRLLGRDYQPLPHGAVKLVVQRGADPAHAETVPGTEVELTTSEDGTAVHELAGLPAGVYRVIGKAVLASGGGPPGTPGREVDATDIFLVREGGTELDRPVGDPATLAEISQVSGGETLGPIDRLPENLGFDPPRIVRVDRRTDVELWSRPGLLVLVITLLGLEWLLRQRSGYL
ncbi:MAG: glutamine amidotransferase [Proteobacteria bacterium]|nr:glutamine amidotransferase [Pseudomonadota bacterium]